MGIFQNYAESIQAINTTVTYDVPIPESFLKNGAGNQLVLTASKDMTEEIEVKINNITWGFLGSGGSIVINKDDKEYIRTISLTNNSGTNTANDEMKLLLRRV